MNISKIDFARDRLGFGELLELRKRVSPIGSETDEFDAMATHYVLKSENQLVMAMRVQHAWESTLDCEQHIPSEILQYRSSLCSASRLVKCPDASPSPSQVWQFLKEIRKQEYNLGVRLDIVNVREAMISYYLPIGYQLLCRSAFTHPRVGTASRLMIFVADSKLPLPKLCNQPKSCRKLLFECDGVHPSKIDPTHQTGT